MDAVCFPEGPTGAHGLRNNTDETVRVLMYSTVSPTAVSVYPDSDKVGIWVETPRTNSSFLALARPTTSAEEPDHRADRPLA